MLVSSGAVGGLKKKVPRPTKAGRGRSSISMAVSARASIAHQKLIWVPRQPKSASMSLPGGSGGRCEQWCEYKLYPTIRGASIAGRDRAETAHAPVASGGRNSGRDRPNIRLGHIKGAKTAILSVNISFTATLKVNPGTPCVAGM